MAAGKGTGTYIGKSKTSYQEALDRAIASAIRAAGPDRSIQWAVSSVSGSSGGIRGGSEFKVGIQSQVA